MASAKAHFNIANVDPVQLRQELAKIRVDGFAISESGYRPGVNSVAAAIVRKDGAVAGSIAVTGPMERLGPERLRTYAPDIVNAATRISEAL